jgi:hypothetical protein
MPTTEPQTGWRIPTMPDAADGPDAFQKLASDAATSMVGPNVSPYTPTWASVGAVQPTSPLAVVGRFRLSQRWCDVYIVITFSASTSGGTDYLYISLPLAPTVGSAQRLDAVLFLPGVGYYNGFGRIDSGSTNCYPHFPRSETSNIHEGWRSASAAGGGGTGIPLVPGGYSVKSGGYIVMSGTYLVP